jgi:hypothetical protein
MKRNRSNQLNKDASVNTNRMTDNISNIHSSDDKNKKGRTINQSATILSGATVIQDGHNYQSGFGGYFQVRLVSCKRCYFALF